jgi:hypothetical protein
MKKIFLLALLAFGGFVMFFSATFATGGTSEMYIPVTGFDHWNGSWTFDTKALTQNPAGCYAFGGAKVGGTQVYTLKVSSDGKTASVNGLTSANPNNRIEPTKVILYIPVGSADDGWEMVYWFRHEYTSQKPIVLVNYQKGINWVQKHPDQAGKTCVASLDSRDGRLGAVVTPKAEPKAEEQKELEVEILSVRGEVEVSIKDGPFVPAAVGMKLKKGDTVSTGFESSCRLKFGKVATMDMGQMTTFAIDQFYEQSNTADIAVALRMGEVSTNVKPEMGKRAKFEIVTPTLTVAVRGTEFNVKHDDKTKVSTVKVTNGTVSVKAKAGGKTVSVRKGYEISIAEGQKAGKAVKTAKAKPASTTTSTTTQEALARKFFGYLADKKFDLALLMMDADAATKKAWGENFATLGSLKIVSVEAVYPNEWTAERESYKFTLDVVAKSEQFGWSTGSSLRWITLQKVNGKWMVHELANNP